MKRARTRQPDQLDEMVAEALTLNVTGATDQERQQAAERFVAKRPMRENSRESRLREVERVYSPKIAPHLYVLMTITDATVSYYRLTTLGVKRRHIFNVKVIKPAYEHPAGPLAWIAEITKQGGIVR
jgi:hypothetical protein